MSPRNSDFSIFYDKISHKLLILKLEALGVNGQLLKWLESFHSNRKQVIVIRKTEENGELTEFFSDPINVPSGLIQGGHVSTMLFLCFIRDLSQHIPQDVNHWFFADDLRIAKQITTPQDAQVLQEAVTCLFSWCQENLMELNISKCKYMSFSHKRNPHLSTFHINNIQLEKINSVRDLGVYLQTDMKFNTHFENILNKSYRMLGFLLRNTREFTNPKTFKMIYYAYVRSKLEYCSVVWNPKHNVHIKSLEALQKKFLRYLAFKQHKTIEGNYSEFMRSNKIMSLENRRNFIDLTYLYKLLNNQIDCTEIVEQINLRVNRRRTRCEDTFMVPYRRKEVGMFSPINRMHHLGNLAGRAGIDIFNCRLTDIKQLFECDKIGST